MIRRYDTQFSCSVLYVTKLHVVCAVELCVRAFAEVLFIINSDRSLEVVYGVYVIISVVKLLINCCHIKVWDKKLN